MFRGVVQICIPARGSCLYDLGRMLGYVVLTYIALGTHGVICMLILLHVYYPFFFV